MEALAVYRSALVPPEYFVAVYSTGLPLRTGRLHPAVESAGRRRALDVPSSLSELDPSRRRSASFSSRMTSLPLSVDVFGLKLEDVSHLFRDGLLCRADRLLFDLLSAVETPRSGPAHRRNGLRSTPTRTRRLGLNRSRPASPPGRHAPRW